MDAKPSTPQVYLSYSHRDKRLVDEFLGQAKVLGNRVRFFHDANIPAGADWDAALRRNLAASRAAIFFLSPDALASEYIGQVEARAALDHAESGKLVVLPFLLRACDWKATPLARFQMLPRSLQPLVETRPRSRAWRGLIEALWTLAYDATSTAPQALGLPAGADRLRLALYAVLSQPAEFEMLERPLSADLDALWTSLDGQRRGAAAVFDELAKRHGRVEPNPLWAAWVTTRQQEVDGPGTPPSPP